MKYEKMGLVYGPKNERELWRNNTAMTPVPLLINQNKVLRIYFSYRDEKAFPDRDT